MIKYLIENFQRNEMTSEMMDKKSRICVNDVLFLLLHFFFQNYFMNSYNILYCLFVNLAIIWRIYAFVYFGFFLSVGSIGRNALLFVPMNDYNRNVNI